MSLGRPAFYGSATSVTKALSLLYLSDTVPSAWVINVYLTRLSDLSYSHPSMHLSALLASKL